MWFYNSYGLLALGVNIYKKKDFIIINFIDIWRLRHHFIINNEARKKWEDPKEFSKITIEMKAIVKLCSLPYKEFGNIIKILIIFY